MEDKVREVVAEWLQLPLDEVTLDTRFEYTGEEMYLYAELALEVEDAFNIKIDDYQDWFTVGDVVRSVEKAQQTGKKETKHWFFGRKK